MNVPAYTIHRDPANFSPYPDDFIPERWLHSHGNEKPSANAEKKRSTPQFFNSPNAFMPFSVGPANCAGKNLAMAEMRAVVTALVHRFDFRLADGYDSAEFRKNLRDFFIVQVGRLPVVVTERA